MVLWTLNKSKNWKIIKDCTGMFFTKTTIQIFTKIGIISDMSLQNLVRFLRGSRNACLILDAGSVMGFTL